jgi:hypothetical protein
MKTFLHYVVLLVVGVVIGMLLFPHTTFYPKTETIVKTDTLVRIDTIIQEKPIVSKVYVKDTIIVPYFDSLRVTDTVYISLPKEVKIYEDSTYYAEVSGYEPNLDSIKVYQRKEIQTITITTKEQKRWSIGVSGGIGVVYDGGWHCGPGINIGVTYSF